MQSLNERVRFPIHIDPYTDAEKIGQAIKGLHKDFDKLNSIITHRSLNQLREIRVAFQKRFGEDLFTSLSKELSGDYESLVNNLFRSPIELLAYDIYHELRKQINSAHVLTTILCCCNNTELYLLKKAYATILETKDAKKASHRSLETDIQKVTKGYFAQLLDELLKCERYEESPEELLAARASGSIFSIVDQSLVDKDVKDLNGAMTEKGYKPDARVLISILTKRSKVHIKAIWKTYKEKYRKNLVRDISSKFQEPFRTAINTLIMTQVDLRLLLLCQLHEALTASEINASVVNRIVCLRLEVDLPEIKKNYTKYFGRDLITDMQSDTSSDYRKLLTLLLSRNYV